MSNDNSRSKYPHRLGLSLMFAAIIFLFLLITTLLVGAIMLFRVRNGYISPNALLHTENIIFSMVVWSIVLGFLLSLIMAKISLHPVKKVINAMDALAHGDFRTRLSFSDPLSHLSTAKEIETGFNHMAGELEKTEMLRSDFVNNFSHEFKTPIVSIAGFADLLLEGNVTPEEEKEYLRVIAEESHRLADLATNVLNLTRVENQTILSDVTRFNLSEQLRNCLLLLENKWTDKDLIPEADFGEVFCSGNRELLQQVWVNLLDNAVKFADPGTVLRVTITEAPDQLMIAVANTGKEIPPEDTENLFRKFWQGDVSHASQGNGIGLSVVKAVTELHGGHVVVSSGSGKTVFTVVLPREHE